MRNKLQKCNITIQINATNYTQIFMISININDNQLMIMINSDATENFMSQTLVAERGFSTQATKNLYDLQVINESLLQSSDRKVNQKTKSLSVAIQQHHEKLIFDIVKMIIYNIILEMF